MKHSLDARNLLCPMPVIRVQDRIESLQPGDILEAVCTDPGARHDIPAWCRVHGHELVDIRDEGREIVVCIRVCAGGN